MSVVIEVRLVNGSSPNEGRVEIRKVNSSWGTICDDHWGIREADVICRMQNYSGAMRALSGAEVVPGWGTIWLQNVKCFGNEGSIALCNHMGWGVHDCGHNNDAGVVCWNQSYSTQSKALCRSRDVPRTVCCFVLSADSISHVSDNSTRGVTILGTG